MKYNVYNTLKMFTLSAFFMQEDNNNIQQRFANAKIYELSVTEPCWLSFGGLRGLCF